MSTRLHAVCVFCGSFTGNSDVFSNAAKAMAQVLVARGISVIYGGSNVGLMGILADAVLEAGGKIVGVMPVVMVEFLHPGLTQTFLVKEMRSRKALMTRMSDAVVALPGGLGTTAEVFEAWSSSRLGLHNKPCGLLNVGGFFDGMVGYVDTMVREGFLPAEHRSLLTIERDPERLLHRLEGFSSPMSKETSAELAAQSCQPAGV